MINDGEESEGVVRSLSHETGDAARIVLSHERED